MSLKLTNEDYIKKCKLKYGDQFQYHNDFNGIKNKISVTCTEHGVFKITADSHLHGKDGGCLKCQRVKQLKKYTSYRKDFIKKCEIVHDNIYDYSKVTYINNQTDVIIICPEHGEFKQRPVCHLNRKQGCPECSKKTMGGYGGYNLKNAEKFKDNWLNKMGYLYFVKIKNSDEEFIKIGITTQKNIRRRFAGICLIYEIEIITSYYDNLYNLIFHERNVLDKFKMNKFKPKIEFNGHSECFDVSVFEKIKDYFDCIV